MTEDSKNKPASKSKIWMADDHQLILDGYRLLLSARPDLEIEGESNDGLHLLDSLAHHNADLIISDLRMPGLDGIELITRIKTNHPQIPLLVVSMSDELEMVYRLFLAETEGYILKNSGKSGLYLAIDTLLQGGIFYEKTLMDAILKKQRSLLKNPETETIRLSPREMEVLQLILNENTSREIAEKLFISKQTVDTHRQHIYEKTGTNTLVGLIKYALRLGLA